MNNLLTFRFLALAAFFSGVTICHAATYTPTIFTDPPVSGGVNSANGVITGGAGNGQVSLRSAVIASNAKVPGRTRSPLGRALTLSASPAVARRRIARKSGDLDINGSLAINGNGSDEHNHHRPTTTRPAATGRFRRQSNRRFQRADGQFQRPDNSKRLQQRRQLPGTFFETGGGIDFFLTGTGNNYSVTNCVVTNNRVQGSSPESRRGDQCG